MPMLITSERDRVTNRKIRIRFLYAWLMDQYLNYNGIAMVVEEVSD
jgi:hypothetical protein